MPDDDLATGDLMAADVGHGDQRHPAADPALAAARALVEGLVRVGWTLAVAESLTGGLVAAQIVAVPGASAVFRGGVVSYASEVKRDVLGVSGDLLALRGAVDPDVAVQMAQGVRRLLKADVGVAVTGVAGPAEQEGHPVGQVFVGISVGEEPAARSHELQLFGSRDQIRRIACEAVVSCALDLVTSHETGREQQAGTSTL